MAWIDYTKTYDIVPHSRIIERLDLFGVAENIKTLFVNGMEKWKLVLFLPISSLICIKFQQHSPIIS